MQEDMVMMLMMIQTMDRRRPLLLPRQISGEIAGTLRASAARMGHTYFADEDGDAPMMQDDDAVRQPLAHQPLPGATPPQHARCCARVRLDYTPQDPCYVFAAVRSPDNSTAAASLSNGCIKLYGCGPDQLAHLGDLQQAHAAAISQVCFPLEQHPNALFSCSRDGTVKAWDTRTRQLAESYQAGRQELFCCCLMGEDAVVAGGEGDVLFWDRRTRKLLDTFDDMHMGDVTQVVHHAATHKLITASEDGLVAVHDVARGLQQDEGFEAALNVGTSVAEVGLYGPQGERLWCRTGTETLQLWEWQLATNEQVQGGDTAFLDLAEARSATAAAAAAAAVVGAGASSEPGCSGAPPPAALRLQQVDYLVGCHYDAASQQLLLVAGDNSGNAAFFPLQEPAARERRLPPGSNPVLPPAVALQGCHEGVVRSVQCFGGDAAGGQLLCLSAGEDARVGLWTLQPEAGHSAEPAGGPTRQHAGQPSKQQRRRSPY